MAVHAAGPAIIDWGIKRDRAGGARIYLDVYLDACSRLIPYSFTG